MASSRLSVETIDPDIKNPLYPGAMTLRDVRIGAGFVTYGVRTNLLAYTTLTSSWTVSREQIYPHLELDTRVIAKGIKSPRDRDARLRRHDIICLDACGIHPFETGEWNRGIFSVVATPENLAELDLWLREKLNRDLMSRLYDVAEAVSQAVNVPAWHRRQLAEVIGPLLKHVA